MKKILPVIYVVLGIICFHVFAYDLENDRDMWTWVWLLNSFLFFWNAHLRIEKK